MSSDDDDNDSEKEEEKLRELVLHGSPGKSEDELMQFGIQNLHHDYDNMAAGRRPCPNQYFIASNFLLGSRW